MEKNDSSRLFDFKDIQIVSTIDKKIDSKMSTKEISKELDIPSRSIRYRIAKLKENNLLQEKSIITHERKLGIRENFFAVEENPEKRKELKEIISSSPVFSWYVPTIGKFNGFLIHALSEIESNFPLEILEKMKEKKLIYDYYHFEIVDYQEQGWNYQYFSEDGKWNWSWDLWEDMIKTGKISQKIDVEFEENPSPTSFDFIDIQILNELYLSECNTQKEIGNKLNLSESQVSRRIKSLEQNGIIRGYRTGFKPFLKTMIILCIIQSNEHLKKIIDSINQIPYPKSLAFKNKSTLGLGIEIPSDELIGLLHGFHLLSSEMDDYFAQIYLKTPQFNPQTSFDLFDRKTNSWIKLNREYEKLRIKYFS